MVSEGRAPLRRVGPDALRPVGPGIPAAPAVPLVPGGDAACWLGELCPECGAVPEGEGAQDPTVPCWRCGTVRASSADGE